MRRSWSFLLEFGSAAQALSVFMFDFNPGWKFL